MVDIMASNPLRSRNLISVKDMEIDGIELVLKESAKMQSLLKEGRSGKNTDLLRNKIMAVLFFEPSTRTRLSFESAMQRLGGGVIGFADPSTSSSIKGESLEDTVKVVSAYSDVIVLRHPKEGVMEEAVGYSDVPIINAGDGTGQHPTQALIDLFTIKIEKNRLNKLNIALIGDLKHARTTHSLAYALAMFGNDLTLIAPPELQMPHNITYELENSYGIEIKRSDSLEQALGADVVYIPRVQRERFADLAQYKRFAEYYRVNKTFLSRADADIMIMSPLPRTTEISREVDATKNAAYFKQAAYGVPVRMAILNLILGEQ